MGAPERSTGQGTVEWQKIQPTPDRPEGTVYSYVAGSATTGFPQYTTSTQPLTAITPELSGNDWWQTHENVYDANGQHLAIVACGRSFVGNWVNTQTCTPATIGNIPNPFGQETYATRWGSLRQTVGYYAPDGTLLWFRYLDADKAYGVTVDRTGHLIIVGEAGNHDPFPETGTSPSYFNPTPGNLIPVSSLPCLSASQLTITKMDQVGNVLWHHYYNTTTTVADAFTQRCVGQHVVETNTDNLPGYRVAGWQQSSGNQRPCIIQVDADGMLQSATRLNSIPGIIEPGDSQVRALYISRCPFSEGERFAVTGYRAVANNSNLTSAWVMYMDDAIGTAMDAEWTQDIIGDNFPGINTAMHTNANRVALAIDGTQPRVVWPVLYDFVQRNGPGQPLLPAASVFASWDNREASSRVYKFDGATGNLLWTSADLGAMRANDLFFSVKPMPNGDYAVACTKASVGFGIDNPMDIQEMNSGITDCLNSPIEPNGLGYDMDGLPNPLGAYNWNGLPWSQCGHYGTDSYVAILRNGSGSLLWQYQWDEGLGTVPSTCFPENWRQRQCDFEITVDPAGDLIVCGNTGHNKDDGYLAKIKPSCDATADYSFFETTYPFNFPVGNPDNQYVLPATTTWTNVNMNVRGSIIVPAGRTLTLNNCNLRFADSRKMGYTCNIVVEPQGKLFVQNNTVLTSLAECPESMWDGIRVLGTNAGDGFNVVAEFRLRSGAIIRNAVVAVTNCQVDPMNPHTGAATQRGGVIIAEDAQLLNNRFDVVLRPYNTGGTPETASNSRFYNTAFATHAFLNYPDLAPHTHLWVEGTRRIRVGSCQFYNNIAAPWWPVENWGTGIRAINTPLQVASMCSGNVFNVNCATADITSYGVFQGMLRGIDYSTNTPLTCFVRHELFDRCAGGVRLTNTTNAVLRENDFVVPDVSTVLVGFPATYGFGVWGGTGFTIENNHLNGLGPINIDPPNVGAIFDNTGPNNNRYYNNTFDKLTYGTIIQGVNDGNADDDGLDLKCNDYGTTLPLGANFRDVVFGGMNPSIGSKQGMLPVTSADLAGNTFTLCDGQTDNLTNMFQDMSTVNMYTYWHHSATAGFNLDAECRLPAIGNFQDGFIPYAKATACPGFIALVGAGEGQQSAMAQAQNESSLLRQVYNAQRDGGNTEALKEYVYNPAHSSSAVRSELMLAAPKVSIETWTEVFKRDPAMNPWHMAQALMANSPLQPEVMRMMEESGLTSFYKQLVVDAQGMGINSQTILESEMAHWKYEHATALKQLVAAAISGEEADTLDDALAMEAEHPEMGTPWARINLLIAKGDLLAAKAIVDGLNAVPEPEGAMEVLGLALALEVLGTPLLEAPVSTMERLHTLADGEGTGMFAAQAWLRLIEPDAYPERILLPMENRSLIVTEPEESGAVLDGLLSVYPNPSQGQDAVYIVAKLLDGMSGGNVQVYDPLGREVHAERFTSATGIVEVRTKGLSSGLYVVVLYGDGTRLGSIKFELTQ